MWIWCGVLGETRGVPRMIVPQPAFQLEILYIHHDWVHHDWFWLLFFFSLRNISPLTPSIAFSCDFLCSNLVECLLMKFCTMTLNWESFSLKLFSLQLVKWYRVLVCLKKYFFFGEDAMHTYRHSWILLCTMALIYAKMPAQHGDDICICMKSRPFLNQSKQRYLQSYLT